jgi:GNAT superfamily N-acetyltransferase
MEVLYRGARAEDLPACIEVFQESVSDLHRRHNQPDAPQPAAWRLHAYRHIHTTGIFHVAELDGQLAGFACAFVRGKVWFLAGFWVKPALQKQHIGAPLLRQVMDAGREAGATTFFVWASSDLPAVSAYMKNGMLPGSQILVFEGAPHLESDAVDYEAGSAEMAFVNSMDEDVLEMRREADHGLMQRLGWQPRQVMHAGQPVGYYYVHGDGVLGPVAWTDARHAEAVLKLGCREAAIENAVVRLMVPGMNHDALRFAFRAGMRLTSYAHLLTSAPFGHLERYLPSGAQLF